MGQSPANDNEPALRRRVRQVVNDLPEVVPITSEELNLLETYFASIISRIAANDNDADEGSK